jgi:copper chaperone CopZ
MTSTYFTQRGILILAVVLVFSCAQSGTEEVKVKERGAVKVSYVDNIDKGGNAQIMIEGMTCERMCVNAVSKSMAAVPSVTIQEMRFDAEKTIDTLIVTFDASKIDEQALIDAVESLAGGDTYHVKEIQLSKDAKTSARIQNERARRGPKVAAESYRFEVPNFFDLLRKVSL